MKCAGCCVTCGVYYWFYGKVAGCIGTCWKKKHTHNWSELFIGAASSQLSDNIASYCTNDTVSISCSCSNLVRKLVFENRSFDALAFSVELARKTYNRYEENISTVTFKWKCRSSNSSERKLPNELNAMGAGFRCRWRRLSGWKQFEFRQNYVRVDVIVVGVVDVDVIDRWQHFESMGESICDRKQ